MHKNKPHILGIVYNTILAALVDVYGANYAGDIETYGRKEKTRQRLASGFVKRDFSTSGKMYCFAP